MLRLRYVVLAAGALGGALASAQFVACSSDEAPAPAPAPGGTALPEAGSVDAPPGPSASQGAVATVAGKRGLLYLGQTAKLDGPAIAPGLVDVRWDLIAVAPGSALTTANITGPSTPAPTFVPDRLGTYTLRVSGTKDGTPAAVVVLVDAIDAPVFWLEGHLKFLAFDPLKPDENQGTLTTAIHVGGTQGLTDRAVACSPLSQSVSSDITRLYDPVSLMRGSAANGDVWEGPPGVPSRVVQPDFVDGRGPGGERTGLITSITVATSTSTCAAGDAKILEQVTSPRKPDGSNNLDSVVVSTSFSPDGGRFAYVHNLEGKARISTMAFDGSGKRVLSPFEGKVGGGLDPDAAFVGQERKRNDQFENGPVKPRWRDATHVAWITGVGPVDPNFPERPVPTFQAAWELYVIEDVAGATAELVMRCSGDIGGFDFLPDGSIVADISALVPKPDSTEFSIGNQNLVVVRPNPTTKNCETQRALTNSPNFFHRVGSVALSPDKSTVAFIGTIPGQTTLFETSLFTVPVDGSSAMTRVPGAGIGGEQGVGPRWVAGGTRLVWGKSEQVSLSKMGSAYSAGGLRSIPVAGGREVEVTTAQHNDVRFMKIEDDASVPSELDVGFVFGYGQGCGVSRASSGALSAYAAGIGACLAALLVRRRRAHSPKLPACA